jgi:hypothetical protein
VGRESPDGLLRVSVKQLEMVHACPRKWAYHYLEGVPQVEAPAVGNAVHADMKALITGAPPVHGPETFIGKMCRELLHTPGTKAGTTCPKSSRS